MDQTDHVPEQAGSPSDTDRGQGAPVSAPVIRLKAVVAAAKYHGLELDIRDFAAEPGEDTPSPATLGPVRS